MLSTVKDSCSEFRRWKISPCRQKPAMVSRIVDVSSTRGSLAIVVDSEHVLEVSAKGGCLGAQLNLFGLCLGKTNRFRHASFM